MAANSPPHHAVAALDNGYTQAVRIRRWANAHLVLLTPAAKWRNGRYAQAYHRFRKLPNNQQRLRRRRTSIEPAFDLLAQYFSRKLRSFLEGVRPANVQL